MAIVTSLPLHRWTVDDYDQMVAAGVLTKEDRATRGGGGRLSGPHAAGARYPS
ncbi:MAG: hypothetical protein ACRDYY_17505 [Acidimicrobiales bacterium]